MWPLTAGVNNKEWRMAVVRDSRGQNGSAVVDRKGKGEIQGKKEKKPPAY